MLSSKFYYAHVCLIFMDSLFRDDNKETAVLTKCKSQCKNNCFAMYNKCQPHIRSFWRVFSLWTLISYVCDWYPRIRRWFSQPEWMFRIKITVWVLRLLHSMKEYGSQGYVVVFFSVQINDLFIDNMDLLSSLETWNKFRNRALLKQ